MINVNNQDFVWGEGITVDSLLMTLKGTGKFTYIIDETTTVIINKEIISRDDYANTVIKDGDKIIMFPNLAGG